MTAPYDLTVAEAAAALRDRRLTATALTASVLDRIKQTEPTLNAYITVTTDHARAQAAAADADLRAGRDRGPLHGIPFALKDVFDTAGIRTTLGADFLRDRVPPTDAAVVRRLYDGGAVLVGKLNLHEFAMGATSINPWFGPVANPWDPTRIAGGSSGGSAAAIAAGSALATLGGDTGGSVRLPAALCGVVGLKPTFGLISRVGVAPISWSLDTVGPITKTVRDAGLMLNALAGYDPDDPGSQNRPVSDCTRDLGRDIRGLRVGVLRELYWQRVDDEVRAVCEKALDVLRDLGAVLSDVQLPLLTANRRLPILTAEGAAYHGHWLKQYGDRYSEDTRTLLESASLIPATAYVNAQRIRTHLIAETRAVLQEVDVLVGPTSPTPAPLITEGDPRFVLSRNVMEFNVTGIPAISVPCGFTGGGLPLGLMIGGRHFDEATLLRVAHAYEQATGWHTRRPPL